jgi:hypothetical protein
MTAVNTATSGSTGRIREWVAARLDARLSPYCLLGLREGDETGKLREVR